MQKLAHRGLSLGLSLTVNRIDLKTPEGKVQKVAVNQGNGEGAAQEESGSE